MVSLMSLCAVLLHCSLLPYDTGYRDTGYGDKHTIYLSKPDARLLTWCNRICCFYDVFQAESAWLQHVLQPTRPWGFYWIYLCGEDATEL